jgi:hypothetical protein
VIERLNFYDLYGYLIPGLCLLGIIWFPIWYIAGVELPKEWTSALAALVLAYVCGHLLQRLSRRAFPSDIEGTDGARRTPSDFLLDDDAWRPRSEELIGQRLTERLRAGVALAIRDRFDIDVVSGPPGTQRGRRQDAFFLSRRALLLGQTGSYAEQFEGMYSLMRGLTAGAVLGAAFAVGWAVGGITVIGAAAPVASVVAHVMLTVVAVWTATFWEPFLERPPATYWLAAGIVMTVGTYLGARFAPGIVSAERATVLIGLTALLIFAANQFHAAYKYFAVHFAATVYRDFYVLFRTHPAPRA